MNIRTYLMLKALDEKVDTLLLLVAALVDEGADREAAKALAVDVKAKTEALRNALPKA
jgi:hypothetical protein